MFQAITNFHRELAKRSPRRAKQLTERVHQHAGDDARFPLRMKEANYDIFKNDEAGNPSILVHTSRPCAECGQPLTGLVHTYGQDQVHAFCVNRFSSRIVISRSL